MAKDDAEDSDTDRILLAHTVRALLELSQRPPQGYRSTGREPLSYRGLHLAALNAKIPAEMDNGRWHIWRSDLPALAEYFGLIEPTAQPPAPAWPPAYQQPPRRSWAMVWPSQAPTPRYQPQIAKPSPQPRRKASAPA